MFGTSGIRGLVGKEITPELALRLGMSLVNKLNETFIIGRDTRTSGIFFENLISAGIIGCGGNVVKIGIAPSPTTALFAKERSAIGVMLTASHNPPEYNGIKVFMNGMEIEEEYEKRITEKISAEKFEVEWDKIGNVEEVSERIETHINSIMELIDTDIIDKKKPKVIIDAGNSAGCVITPYILQRVGCKVIGLNTEPSGFFSRGLEPNKENLSELCEVVRRSGADMGIAHDGDADRTIIVDEKGELLGLDAQLGIMCKEVLSRKKGKIIITVEASLGVKENIEKFGGKPIITKVGSVNVAKEIKKLGAVFGGEPCGEYIFPEEILVPDGVLTALKFVELFSQNGSLREMKKDVKEYPIKRAKLRCENKAEVMEKIKEELPYIFKGNVSFIDGVRIDFDDGWLMVRASGTEPIIRITCEHKDKDKVEEIFRKANEFLTHLIRSPLAKGVR